ncbi:MAG: hypothetical protein Q8L14_36860 [Myxococcales bacterium]|nr:hypothetical protein [Myxococcales bacterium]
MRVFWPAVVVLIGCGAPTPDVDSGVPADVDAGRVADAGTPDSGASMDAAIDFDAGVDDAGSGADASIDAGVTFDAGMTFDAGLMMDAGFPNVDRASPQLYRFQFTAQAAEPDAGRWTGNQLARLDTRVAPRGLLVVYLHGAGTPTTCGSGAHQDFLAGLGFHTIGPCYATDYGVGNCGNQIGECRLEAFDGVDRHPFISITRAESLERRIVRMLQRLQTLNPQGDWQYFLVNGAPRWDRIVISGISHGASSAGVIAKVRSVHHAVMLSGPLDTNQAWLALPSLTPSAQLSAFTHTGDPQHPGHLDAFETMGLPGAPTRIEDGGRPWAGSHRLFTSVTTADPHGSTQAGGSSPRTADGGYRFAPVWQELYEQ